MRAEGGQVSPTRRAALSGLVGVAMAAPTFAADPDPAGLHHDVDLLRRVYDTLHPGLYRYQTPALFAAGCEALKAASRRPASLGAQYLALSRLLAQVRCGHTYANFFNQSAAVSRALFEAPTKLPFHFVWIGPRMVVLANPRGVDGLARGDEILAIDGVPAAAVQAKLLPYMRADGSNDDKRRSLLEVTGADRIESFDVFHSLLFPVRSDAFTLTRRAAAGGATRTLRVGAIDLAARRAMAPRAADKTSPDYWSLAWPASGVALLTMPSWAMYDVKWDWRARIDALFDEIAAKSARGLIIDLRDNEGGDDCGEAIIAHLIEADLPLGADDERRVRFRSTPPDLNRYLDTWDRSFEHLGEGAEDLGNGFFRLKTDLGAGRIAPKGPRFKGQVAVLAGPKNSSATFQFIAQVRRHGLARIYGRPTGGNQRGINGGSFFFVRLPASGLEADLPLVGVFPNGPRPDAGLPPDVRIDPTLEDVAQGRDRALERAIADMA